MVFFALYDVSVRSFLLGLLLCLLSVFAIRMRHLSLYWKRRCVYTPKGSLFDFILQKKSSSQFIKDIYDEIKEHKQKHAGIMLFGLPVYIPVDTELIKNILIKDFDHFVDRGIYFNEKDEPVSANLFCIEGEKWKILRAKLSPTFTSGKMKMMFPTVVECSSNLITHMEEISDETIDIKDALGKFTTDVIGSCAFGIDCNSFQEPESEFRRNGKRIFQLTAYEAFRVSMGFVFPNLMRKLGAYQNPVVTSNFFLNMMKKTVEYREKHNLQRKDFLHLLLQLRNRGELSDDDMILKEHSGGSSSTCNLSVNEIAAQAYLFFIAGFETSSTTMAFCLYEVSRNTEIQEKLRSEIFNITEKYEGQLTYEGINEMKYLDMVITETLRKYPALPFLNRVCTKEYPVPGTDLILEKGVKIMVPLYGIHQDDEFYPDPEKFDPERFNEENKQLRPSMTYMPFGDGPRNCIGMRFGLMQTKIGICKVLMNFTTVLDTTKTILPLEMEKTATIPTVKGRIWLKCQKITDLNNNNYK